MFGMYIGRHDNKVDTKGRVSIPAEFRRMLEAGDPEWASGKNVRFGIVFGDHRRNYLEIYSVDDLMAVHADIQKLPRKSMKRHQLERLYAHQTQMGTVDETGRLVLSKFLRDKAGIGDKALVLGSSQTFQIWDPDTYERNEIDGLLVEEDFDESLDPAVWLDSAPSAPDTI